jgi:hypothetical protein
MATHLGTDFTVDALEALSDENQPEKDPAMVEAVKMLFHAAGIK